MMEYPSHERYQTNYQDRFGNEQTVIENDGKTLRMVVRGVEFAGSWFDDFEPLTKSDVAHLASFTLNRGELCSCTIECEMPMLMVSHSEVVQAVLHVNLKLGDPAPNGGLDHEWLGLTLSFEGNSIQSSGKSGWFEDELLEIQASLPEGVYMKACINCQYSEYSP